MDRSAAPILDSFTVHYHFLREHESMDGQTHAKKAAIALPFEDERGDLIRWAKYRHLPWTGVAGSVRATAGFTRPEMIESTEECL